MVIVSVVNDSRYLADLSRSEGASFKFLCDINLYKAHFEVKCYSYLLFLISYYFPVYRGKIKLNTVKSL